MKRNRIIGKPRTSILPITTFCWSLRPCTRIITNFHRLWISTASFPTIRALRSAPECCCCRPDRAPRRSPRSSPSSRNPPPRRTRSPWRRPTSRRSSSRKPSRWPPKASRPRRRISICACSTARILRDERRFPSAAEEFSAAAKIKPDAAEAWTELAGVLIMAEQPAGRLGGAG